MAKQLGFLLNQKNCIGCQGCQTACQSKNDSPVGLSLRVAGSYEYDPEGPFMSGSCHHCENPPCLTCPAGAISKRVEDGIVVTDLNKCVGCRRCVRVCPYSAPKFNERISKSQKCDFCLSRLDEGDIPACVENCPVHALGYGDLSALEARGGVRQGAKFNLDRTVNPSIRFILPR
jgi:Fe-S-cluster-containing dehydrogenase component